MRTIESVYTQKIYTVADLRELLKDQPDDRPVIVEHTDMIARPIVGSNVSRTWVNDNSAAEDVLFLECAPWGREK